MIRRRHRHRHRHAIQTMNSGVTTQAAGGIQIAVPVTGPRDNAAIAESGNHALMNSCASGLKLNQVLALALARAAAETLAPARSFQSLRQKQVAKIVHCAEPKILEWGGWSCLPFLFRNTMIRLGQLLLCFSVDLDDNEFRI
jgi:hypothetical protein